MKKTKIGMVAIAASVISTNVMAVGGPIGGTSIKWEHKTICLETRGLEGTKTAITCDQARNNKLNNRAIQEHGCTWDQVAVNTSRNVTAGQDFGIKIKECRVVIDGQVTIGPVQL